MKPWAKREAQAPKPATAPQPATAIASHRVRPDALRAYIQARTEITDAARRFPGLVGTEVPGAGVGLQEEWVAIFRLESLPSPLSLTGKTASRPAYKS